jgi:predicted nucleotide-binding protein
MPHSRQPVLPPSSDDHTALTRSRSEVAQQLAARIKAGKDIQSRAPESAKDYEKYRADAMKWWDYNAKLLRTLFSGNLIVEECIGVISPTVMNDCQHCSFIDLCDNVAAQITKLESVLDHLDFYPEAGMAASAREGVSAPRDISKVFVVHGHDEGGLQAMARFLQTIGLEAVILREQPDQGRTIIEKFEACASEVGFAVALLTPDDLGGPVAASEYDARARQNVIFELGYFVGRLGRGRACLLRKGDVEIPSDLFGVIYTDFDHPAESWKVKLARELKVAGFKFDVDKGFA